MFAERPEEASSKAVQSESLMSYAFGRPLHCLWGLVASLVVFLWTIFVSSVAIVGILVTRKPWPGDVMGRAWGRGVLWMCGITVELDGLEHIRPGQSYILISNHLSTFDVWCTLGTLPLTIRFVTKKELLSYPALGIALRLSEHIIIDRENKDATIKAINDAAARSPEGVGILLYAEGTRSPDGKVHPFKKGGVTLAMRSGLPILPLSVSGTSKYLPKGSPIIRPGGTVKLVVGQPIPTVGVPFEARDELNERVRNVVVENFIEDY